ncbi:MAG: toprim domain-containing protein [Candidatus Micrarchaeota archaeon]|nr:toprim domain-containing protein [Candidatus Micrarchaeota archaeon]
MDNYDKYSSLQKLLVNLNTFEDITKEKTAILVEGKKDKLALLALDINLPIFECARDKHKTIEFLTKNNFKNVILLMDLDKQGNKLAHEMSEMLLAQGIKPNLYFRKELGKFLKLKYFEEMSAKIDNFYQLYKR